MEICSIEFLLACCGIVLAFHLLPFSPFRRCFLGVANVLFLLPLVPNWQSAAWLVLFLGGTYGALLLVRARPGQAVVWTAIVLALGVFTYVKRYSFIPLIIPVELWYSAWSQHQFVMVVGLSYMLFKFIHMLVDQREGQLAPFTFLSYLNYQLAFFTLVAGPIQRYNDFKRGWDEMDRKPTETRESLLAWNRVMTGMIKMRVVAPLILFATDQADSRMGSGQPDQLWHLLISFYSYPIQLYFNFSGYTDVAIGCPALLGFQVPENFNRPFVARNMLDFWNRWHMSLSSWIRDYVFMTSYKAAATKFPRGAKYWSYALLFVALFITGIWHGTTQGFAVFGLLNGVAVAVNRVYADILKSALGRAGVERYLHNRLIRCLAVVATFHYVCFCHLAFAFGAANSLWYVFVNIVRQAVDIIKTAVRPEWTGGNMILLCILSILFAGLWKADTLERARLQLAVWLTRSTLSVQTVVFAQVLIVIFLFCFDRTFEQEPPPIVYMRF